jgi:hypothetical protein
MARLLFAPQMLSLNIDLEAENAAERLEAKVALATADGNSAPEQCMQATDEATSAGRYRRKRYGMYSRDSMRSGEVRQLFLAQ